MRRLKLAIPVACVLLISAGFAYASAGEGHELPWGNFLLRILNVLLFVGVIAYFFGKKITGFFKDRTNAISHEISALEQRKIEAQANLVAVEQRIANLDAECSKILEEYKSQGEALKAAIIAQAEKSAQQITAQAQVSAQNEVNHAIALLRAEMAEKIVEATEKLLTKQLTAEEHTKLIDKYLTKVVLN